MITLSPSQARRQIAEHLDAAVQSLMHSRGAFNEGEYPLMRLLVDDALGHLKSANRLNEQYQGKLQTTEQTTKHTNHTKGK